MAGFAEILQIRPGVTAIIGSGGKTTLLYALAQELSQKGSVIVATSTHIFRPDQLPVVSETGRVEGCLCVGTATENGKLCAPRQSFEELEKLADYVLVEADGSKRLPLKAHESHEPVIPANANQVICVVGASGLGKPAEEVVHRAARFVQITGSDVATPEAVARLLRKENFHTQVLVNQADSPERIAAAKEVAGFLTCPVHIAALQKGEIIC